MAKPILLASLGYFSGINNIDEPVSLVYDKQASTGYKAVYPLQVAENVFLDNSMHIQSRTDGQTIRVSGNIHSAWSDETIFLYILADTLYSLDKYYTSTALLSGLTYGLRMSYASFNDRIYFSNGINIGYIKGGIAYSLSTPAIEFKLPLPAGKHIAHYRTRLYSTAGKVLYISDPLSDCYDVRSGFRYFKDDIVMVRPVENGIYIADTKTWFLKGLVPEEFSRELIDDGSVIPYTDVNADGNYIGDGGKGGVLAIWTAVDGICIGDGDGNVTNITKKKFAMVEHIQGSAVIRNTDGIFQYINTMRQ